MIRHNQFLKDLKSDFGCLVSTAIPPSIVSTGCLVSTAIPPSIVSTNLF
jgi:hypothetical protein